MPQKFEKNLPYRFDIPLNFEAFSQYLEFTKKNDFYMIYILYAYMKRRKSRIFFNQKFEKIKHNLHVCTFYKSRFLSCTVK